MNTVILSFLLSVSPIERQAVRYALSAVESGGDDKARGQSGERSRYQILPREWARHTILRSYTDEHQAWNVATEIINERVPAFRNAMRRDPSHAELYALWHRNGKFAKVGYQVWKLSRLEQERCAKFQNIVESKIKELKGAK